MNNHLTKYASSEAKYSSSKASIDDAHSNHPPSPRWLTVAAGLLFGLGCCIEAACSAGDSPNPLLDQGSNAGASGSNTGAGSDGSSTHEFAWYLRESRYQTSPAFEKINAAPFDSVAVSGSKINIYVSKNGADAYSQVDPGHPGSHATVPAYTSILREVVDPSGKVAKITVMYKGPCGYNPDLGDWYFGVFDTGGNVLNDGHGAPQSGKLSACYSCHIPHRDDDYLFGVPASAR